MSAIAGHDLHWNCLDRDAQQALARLVEDRHGPIPDEFLAELRSYGLIRHGKNGWQPTQAGWTAYVVRDIPSSSASSVGLENS